MSVNLNGINFTTWDDVEKEFFTPEEIADIEAAEKKGVQVYAQMVPNDEKKTFRSYLN